ncbi:MAG TPA: PmoA family protein [Caldilineaceae bacterium]|nr:PmoA family protein [Caldilineaceae bacterium]
MTLTLTHRYNRAIAVGYGDQLLFSYVYVPDMPQSESPKPYFHPIHTLGGNEISCYRPYDHLWHKGLQMTMAHLSTPTVRAQNFWGGGSYVHGHGYVQLPNNGSMDHQHWRAVELTDDAVTLHHTLAWLTEAGDRWLDEERRIVVNNVDARAGTYCLDFHTALTNVWTEELHFGSPTTAGRPNAGYGGLFWRGPRSFTPSGTIRTAGGLHSATTPEAEIMGSASNWLAYSGRHDGSGHRSTLLFLDHPANPRYPNKWFVRRDPFACVSFAFSFDEELPLPVGETLTLRYRIVIGDGEVGEEVIADHVARWQE